MKISFGIEEDSRSIYLITKDPLELAVMNHLTEMSLKGTTMQVSSNEDGYFKIEMKLAGFKKESRKYLEE